ncbi:MAG: class I SAM-dependent methyltransferase [Myxococcales bacterium]|nr:class I SAM-dependent methyltransferase [Myxococcales bacterium]
MLTPEEALLQLGKALRRANYQFVTVTPLTHGRILARRPTKKNMTLRDVFGWNRPFALEDLPSRVRSLARAAGVLRRHGNKHQCTVRFSTVDQGIFVHSGYPTSDQDSVFFGPDTYRFCALIGQHMGDNIDTVLDIGCGSGAGGLVTTLFSARSPSVVVLADINEQALRFAKINAQLNAPLVNTHLVKSDICNNVRSRFDLIVSNPPYLIDSQKRVYRDGGELGIDLAERIVRQGINRLSPKGKLVLYSGSPIMDGKDILLSRLNKLFKKRDDLHFRYSELDPDIFGEELEQETYQDVERIAAIGCVVRQS